METCPGFFLKSLLESPGNLLEICSVKFVHTLLGDSKGIQPAPSILRSSFNCGKAGLLNEVC